MAENALFLCHKENPHNIFSGRLVNESSTRELLHEEVLFITEGNICKGISHEVDENSSQISCEQIEAARPPKRMLFHTQKNASEKEVELVGIVSDDTDVLVLALAICGKLQCHLFVIRGTQGNKLICTKHLGLKYHQRSGDCILSRAVTTRRFCWKRKNHPLVHYRYQEPILPTLLEGGLCCRNLVPLPAGSSWRSTP